MQHLLEVLAAVSPTGTERFEELARLVRSRGEQLSGCILVFVHWDAARRRLAESLFARGIEVRALLVCERAERPGSASRCHTRDAASEPPYAVRVPKRWVSCRR